MEHYFITTHHVQPKNAKARAVVEYCNRFQNTLAQGKISYDAIYAELKLLCERLNERDHKSRPVSVLRTIYYERQMEETEHLTFRFDGDVNNDIFQLNFTKVRNYYQFSENLNCIEP